MKNFLPVPGIIKCVCWVQTVFGLAPWQLNASFLPSRLTGQARFISQSAAVSNTILDWAQQREMGFSSYFIALGDSPDIDVDELLDYLAR